MYTSFTFNAIIHAVILKKKVNFRDKPEAVQSYGQLSLSPSG